MTFMGGKSWYKTVPKLQLNPRLCRVVHVDAILALLWLSLGRIGDGAGILVLTVCSSVCIPVASNRPTMYEASLYSSAGCSLD